MRSVWLVTIGEPLIGPAERRAPLRVGRLAMWLRDAGWDVTWWTSGLDHFRKVRFTDAERRAAESTGVRFQWLDGSPYRENVSLAREWNHVQLAMRFRRQSLRTPSPSVIAVSFPPIELAAAVSSYASGHNIPVVVDIRDLWPDVFEWAAPARARPFVRLAVAPLRGITGAALRRATAIVGVSEGYLQWGLSHARRPRRPLDDVIPIFGPPRQSVPRARGTGYASDGRTVVAFVGSFGRSYDIRTVVEAARRLPKDVADRIHIVIGGDGDERVALQSGARDLEHLTFTGWLDARGVSALLSRAQVGLAAYAPGALQSLPNKIIDYLSYDLPIVGSLGGECQTLLERTGAGWTYRAGDADSLAGVLSTVIRDPASIGRAAEQARALFASDFAPENSMARYAKLLEVLADGRG